MLNNKIHYHHTLLIIVFLIFSSKLYPQVWNIETVDIIGELKLPVLSFDSQNNPGIVYADYQAKKLKYAFKFNGSWTTEIIMHQEPLYNYAHDFTFDPEDNPSMICIKTDRSDLYYVRHNGSQWIGNTVEAVERCDRTGEVSIDYMPSTGYSAFAYMGVTGEGVKYAEHNGTLWELEVLDETKYACRYNELKFDNNDIPYVVYSDSRNDTLLKCASKIENVWQIDVVDSTGLQPSLAIGNDNQPWIAYIKPDYTLYIANKINDEWIKAKVDDMAYHPVLKINPLTNLPAITYEKFTSEYSLIGIYYNEFTGTEWGGMVVGEKAVFPGLDFSSDGHPAICYIKDKQLHYSTTSITDVEKSEPKNAPKEFLLHQNYPNPFNPNTTISYKIPTSVNDEWPDPAQSGAIVNLVVFDVLGREITRLVNEQQKPGNYKVVFDGTDLTSGIYFYQLQVYPAEIGAEYFVDTKKMLMLK